MKMDIDLKHSNGSTSHVKTSPANISPVKRTNESDIESASKRAKPNHILHILNFKRPLLVNNVQDLLNKYGTTCFFWMDKVRTFVIFRSGRIVS
jgi:hypothetical protein